MSTTQSNSHFETWTSMLTTLLGVIATVWGLGLAILIIGAPIALAVNLALRAARAAF